MYIHQSETLDIFLSSIYVVRDVCKKERVKGCPYDGIRFCSTAMPKRSFLALATRFKKLNKKPSSHYQHVLLSNLFHVYWIPVTSNNKWTTMVRINPNKHELTPQGVLDLLAYVFEDLSQVYVASYDEKIDLENITVDEVVKGLKIPHSRSMQDSVFVNIVVALSYFISLLNSFKSPVQSKLARCACCPVDVQWKEKRLPLNIHREKGKFFILE